MKDAGIFRWIETLFQGIYLNDRPVNLELYIARKLLKGGEKSTVSVPIVKIALAGITLGVCVMLLSVFIITGFKKEITDKLTGFSSHLNITAYGTHNTYDAGEVWVSDTLLANIGALEEVGEVYRYVTKPAILKSKKEIHGIILCGVDAAYKGDFFRKHLVEGEFPDFRTENASNEILLSASVASLLEVGVGEKLSAHFVQDPPRVRAFTVKGIYDTGFGEYDRIYVLCDLRHLQRLNDWKPEEVSGVAVGLKNLDFLSVAEEKIYEILPWGEPENFFKIQTLYDMAPSLFDWLELLNMNVWIILILIVVVAGFNMVSGLLILILDKTGMIGILKALGYRNIRLRKLFLYVAAGLIGKGLIWGNVLAFVLAGIQYFFRLIPLDPVAYYMDTVPVCFNWGYVFLLDAGVLVVSTLMLVVPTMLISRIRPIKAIRFE